MSCRAAQQLLWHLYIVIRNRQIIWKQGSYCWYFFLTFNDQCSHHTSQLICSANQLTGFYMMRTLVVQGFKLEISKVTVLEIHQKSQNGYLQWIFSLWRWLWCCFSHFLFLCLWCNRSWDIEKIATDAPCAL